jgi:hypothetical protein
MNSILCWQDCLSHRQGPLTASNSWIYAVQEIALATEMSVNGVAEFSPMKYCLHYRERHFENMARKDEEATREDEETY